MEIGDVLHADGVIPALKATNKKQVLQEVAARAARLVGVHERVLFETLLERERLGSTGVGHGVAIPHGRLPGLDRLWGLFARLEQPIDFDSVDHVPVDLMFVLLAPEGAGADHLKALARISRLLRDKSICEKLRGTDNRDALYALLTDTSAGHAPA